MSEEDDWGGGSGDWNAGDYGSGGFDLEGVNLGGGFSNIISSLPAIFNGGGIDPLIGGGGFGGGLMAAGAAAGAGMVSLGAKLARMVGGSAASFTINGVKGSMASLWPMVRKYGPVSVAAALGIGADQLAQLLMRAPTAKRGRRRGISAANIRTAKRVIRFNRSLSRSLGVNRGSSRSAPRWIPPHRHRSYR